MATNGSPELLIVMGGAVTSDEVGHVVARLEEAGVGVRVTRGREATVIGAIGDRATDSSPFAHLFLEPIRLNPDEDHDFHVMLRTWPSGERRWLGTAHPHGIPVIWT